MTRLYGRAPRGQRVIGSVPQNYGEPLTVLAALDRHGMRASMAFDGATDGPVFLTFLRQVLCPQLRSGDIVVLDNLRAHHVPGVAEAVADAGALLRYLPPYSPDYNPIEFAWQSQSAATNASRTDPAALIPRTRLGFENHHSAGFPRLVPSCGLQLTVT